MEEYIKQEFDKILKSKLIIYHWYNNKKHLDFKGTIDEWCDKNKIIPMIVKEKYEIEFDIGSLHGKMKHGDFETLIRATISLDLSYIGAKSEYTLLGRTKTFNK